MGWGHLRAAARLSRLGIALYLMAGLLQGAGMASLQGGLALGPSPLLVAYLCNLLSFLSFVTSVIVWYRRKLHPGTLWVRDDSLVFEGAASPPRVVPRAALRSAFVVSGPSGPRVELGFNSGDVVSILAADAPTAHALVHTLGFGAGGRSSHVTIASPHRRWFHPVIGWASSQLASFTVVTPTLVIAGTGAMDKFNIAAAIAYPLATGAAIGLYLLGKRLFRPWELTIGDDGVRYQVGLKQRFVPRAEITHVEHPFPGAPVTVHAGPHTFRVMGVGTDDQRRRTVAELIHTSLQRSKDATGRERSFQLEGSSAANVRARFRQLFDGGNYREAGISAEDAYATLESPSATAEQRVGAALALRVQGEDPVRIRVASGALADEATQEALEAVASDAPDAVLDRALLRMRKRR
jgi:hypothetical protein